jgi:hypothetical protein
VIADNSAPQTPKPKKEPAPEPKAGGLTLKKGGSIGAFR